MWSEHIDPSSGKAYYANSETGETQWNKPSDFVSNGNPSSSPASNSSPAPSPPTSSPPTHPSQPSVIDIPGTSWSRVLDSASQRYYYANKINHAVSWSKPAEVEELELRNTPISSSPASAHAIPLATPEEEEHSGHTLSSTSVSASPDSFSSPSRPRVNSYAQPAVNIAVVHSHDRVLDAESGRYYYVDKSSGETTWTVPASWLRVQELEAQLAAARNAAADDKDKVNATRPINTNQKHSMYATSPAALGQDPNAASTSSSSQSCGFGTLTAAMGGMGVAEVADSAIGGNSPPPRKGSRAPPPLPPHVAAVVAAAAAKAKEAENTNATANATSPASPRSGPVPPPLPVSHSFSSQSQSQTQPAPAVLIHAMPPPLPQTHRTSMSVSTPASASVPQAPRLSVSASFSSTLPSASSPSSAPPTLSPSIAADIKQFALGGFAANHFRTFKKRTGLVSKTVVDVTELLSWQRTPINKSLLTATKKYTSEAVTVFKKILCFMGDSAEQSKKVPAMLATEIVGMGVRSPPLRDEILAQLCKQTKLNPEPASCAAGWRLMVLCCAAFAPTRGFQQALTSHFVQNFNNQTPPEASILSRFCYWRMHKTIRETSSASGPAAAGHGHASSPSMDDRDAPHLTLGIVEDMGRHGVKSVSVLFPGHIEYLLWVQASEKNPVSTTVPEIVIRMCHAIRNLGGMKAKGIFRIAAQRENISKMRSLIELGKWDHIPGAHIDGIGDGSRHMTLMDADPHTPADVLKHWLRDLLLPVIPMSVYDTALKVSDDQAACVELVESQLSSAHFATLDYILTFLAELATHQEETMMNEENLAIVFSQDLLRTDETNPQVIMANSTKEKRFTRQLIHAWGEKRSKKLEEEQ